MKSLVTVVLALLIAAPAYAGSVYLFAESARFTANNTECSHEVKCDASNKCYTVVHCVDSGSGTGEFFMPAVLPSDATSPIVQFKFHTETDSGVTGTLYYNIGAYVYADDSPSTFPFGAALNFSSVIENNILVNNHSEAQRRRVSVPLPGGGYTPRFNDGTEKVCTAAICAGHNMEVLVQRNVLGTTTSFDLRMIEMIYN